jgi:hypothetical protein
MTSWLSLLGPAALMATLVMLGLICRRFGQATGAAPYYLGLFVSAFLVGISLFARIANLILGMDAALAQQQAPAWTLLYFGLPAIGLTLALIVAWRYWSWLLADRD